MILLLGGARSGKSSAAVRLATDAPTPVTFIATAEAGDAEMAERIDRHRAERSASWTTVEAPLELLAAVGSAAATDFLVVDCLTLWVANLQGAGCSSEAVLEQAGRVAAALAGRRCVVVSNEVGLGIVPANEAARSYRDLLGSVNATFAAVASRTLLLVAGRAVALSAIDSALVGE